MPHVGCANYFPVQTSFFNTPDSTDAHTSPKNRLAIPAQKTCAGGHYEPRNSLLAARIRGLFEPAPILLIDKHLYVGCAQPQVGKKSGSARALKSNPPLELKIEVQVPVMAATRSQISRQRQSELTLDRRSIDENLVTILPSYHEACLERLHVDFSHLDILVSHKIGKGVDSCEISDVSRSQVVVSISSKDDIDAGNAARKTFGCNAFEEVHHLSQPRVQYSCLLPILEEADQTYGVVTGHEVSSASVLKTHMHAITKKKMNNTCGTSARAYKSRTGGNHNSTHISRVIPRANISLPSQQPMDLFSISESRQITSGHDTASPATSSAISSHEDPTLIFEGASFLETDRRRVPSPRKTPREVPYWLTKESRFTRVRKERSSPISESPPQSPTPSIDASGQPSPKSKRQLNRHAGIFSGSVMSFEQWSDFEHLTARKGASFTWRSISGQFPEAPRPPPRRFFETNKF